MEILKPGLTTVILVLGILVSLDSCTPVKPDATLYASLDSAQDLAGPSDFSSGQGSATDLEGTWFVLAETSNCVDALGSMLETMTWAWYILELERVSIPGQDPMEEFYAATMIQCHLDLSPVVMSLRPYIPYPLLDGLNPLSFTLTARVNEDGTRTISTPVIVEQWGLALEDPILSDVPVTAEGKGVKDGDGDGNPGVTLVLGENFCDMYVVQRAINIFEGEVADGVSLGAGKVISTVTKNLIGGTDALCTVQNTSFSNNPRNRFWMVRVDGDGSFPKLVTDDLFTCEEIRSSEIRGAARELIPGEFATPDSAECIPPEEL